MRKILITFFLCTSYLLLNGQESKINQFEPANKKAGRQVKLEKVMTITDKQGGFYFRMPRRMQVTSDGSIFIMELNQMLRFDRNGKLLNNYHRKGEGPGEFVMISSFLVKDDVLIVFSSMPNKIMWFKKNGALIKEFRMKDFSFGDLILYRKNKYYFVTTGIPFVKGEAKYIDVEHKIFKFSSDGKDYSKLISFPVKKYVMSKGKERRSFSIGKFIAKVYEDKFLVVSHTTEYLVRLYDIEQNKITRTFSRQYKRVKSKNEKWKKNKLAPKLDFDKDINDIQVFKDKIFVFTSTQHEKRGRLIDVFDYDGNYTDNFFVQFSGSIFGCEENHLFLLETDKSENIVIAKYEIKK